MSEIKATQTLTRTEVADYLREFAAQLDTAESDGPTSGGGSGRHDDRSPTTEQSTRPTAEGSAASLDDRVTFLVGNDSATVNPPEEFELTAEVDTDSPLVGGDAERHVTFDLAWNASDVEDPDVLDIE